MSYLVLARKSRPQTFEEVVGQKTVVKTLQNSLKRNRVAHAILFSGVRGVGKTTLARLMAKALNCANGPTPTPCNQCLSCRQITDGASLDLYEIDGASNRGIQEVRELKEKIKFLPSSSSYKIVIIDEVHMLTTEAFNALLKTLEEPPEHVYFMFATTELQKIPITILSRCQRYELKRVSSEELSAHFQGLAAKEGIEIENDALSLIVRESEGSVRDGLSLLDQVFSYGESPITTADVVEVLGLVNRDILNNITKALLQGDRATALASLSETFRFGMDTKRFMSDLLECFRALLLVKIEGCASLLDISEEDMKTLQVTAEMFSAETIHLKLRLLMKTAEELRHSLQPKLLLETAFLSIIESDNVVPVASLLEKLDRTIASLPDTTPHVNAPIPKESGTETKKKIAEPEKVADEPPPPEQETGSIDDTEPPWLTENPVPEEPVQPESPKKEIPPPQPIEEPEKSNRTAGQPGDPTFDWTGFISFVKQQRPGTGHNLEQASETSLDDNVLTIAYNSQDECILRSPQSLKDLEAFAHEFFGRKYILKIICPETSAAQSNGEPGSPQEIRKKLAGHPLVQMTEELLGGRVGDVRLTTRKKQPTITGTGNGS